MLGARARALARRPACRPRSTTCWRCAGPVFRHRMALNFTARADGAHDRQRHRASEGADRLSQLMPASSRLRSQRSRRSGLAGAAAAAGRGPAHRRDRHSRRPWPQALRARRNLLAIPALQLRRFDPAHRLAQVGALRPRVHPRERMGSGQHAVAVAVAVALDDVPVASCQSHQARPRRTRWPSPWARWRCAPMSACRADRRPLRSRPCAPRPDPHRRMALANSKARRCPIRSACRDFRAPC